MLELTAEERAWLDSYQAALDKKHPGAVHEIVIYGSKARGQAHAESDLDLLLIVKDGSGKLKRELRRIGYRLAATTDVLPSILAYTGRGVGEPKARWLKFPESGRARRGARRMNCLSR